METINQIQDKALMWYFHPNECVRMMRTNIFDNIDVNEDLTPSYKDNIKVGVVIGTNGAVPYIDLSLHYLINVNGIKHILIHDDGSDKIPEFKKLQNKYNKNGVKVDLYSTGKNLWHKSCIGSIGDQNCFAIGLKWAKENNLDILVKFSRRLIACFNWIDDFKKLVKESNGITFGSYCVKDKFPLRTELLGMNVNAWNNPYVINMMSWFIENEYSIFAEHFMDKLAKVLDYQNNSEKYKKWKESHKTGYIHSGYVHWKDILGTNRYNNEDRNKNVLWHMFKNDNDYLNESKKVFGDKYSLDDFKNIVNI